MTQQHRPGAWELSMLEIRQTVCTGAAKLSGGLHCCPDARAAVPTSLVRATGNLPAPHLEYYLGFSDHSSSLKQQMVQQLRAMGSVSSTECKDTECNAAFRRQIEYRKRREE